MPLAFNALHFATKFSCIKQLLIDGYIALSVLGCKPAAQWQADRRNVCFKQQCVLHCIQAL